jgi:hypothetical protein
MYDRNVKETGICRCKDATEIHLQSHKSWELAVLSYFYEMYK